MVEPLLHFAVPFTSVRAVGIDWRKALFASLVALAPDLDVFFHIHRSQSHSLVLLAIIVLPLLILTRKHRTARTLVLLGAFGLVVHIILDLFGAPTPLFWPLFSQSPWISITLNLQIGSAPFITGSTEVQVDQNTIAPFAHFNEPLVTAPGFAVSLLLLTPTALQILRNRFGRPLRPKPQ